ncbi:MAG: phosphoribosyltransferase, partial [Halopseudomonas sp.]
MEPLGGILVTSGHRIPSYFLLPKGHEKTPVNFRSVNDLACLTSKYTSNYASKVPRDVDLIVGIPRSGMLVASIIALKLNLPLTDLYSFIRNDELARGNTRSYKHHALVKPQDAQKILLVDDSNASGNSMREAQARIREVYP